MAPRTAHDGATAAVDWSLWSTSARLVVTDPAELDAARAIVDRETRAVEEASSRFRADSEVVRLAAEFPSGALVGDTLAALIRAALLAANLTEGAVDPTLGRAMSAIGYDRDIRLILDEDGPVRAVATDRPGWKYVTIDGGRLTVPAGLELDLGATA
ncbi:MAG: FAD:protein FMN transferase, partial [Actinomycetota bacterium]|nr:FAD:protein FMN transferase [Actinomycetota bacterium]